VKVQNPYLRFRLFRHGFVSDPHGTLVPVEHRVVVPNIGGQPSQTFRTPNQKFPIILRQLVIRRIIQRPSRTVICTKMAKTAPRVPVLRETVFGILSVFFSVRRRDEGYASLGADPCAYAAAGAFVHVENVSASVSLGELQPLVRVFHCESSFEYVFDSFIHCVEDHTNLPLPIRLYRPVIQAAINDRHVRDVYVPEKVRHCDEASE